MLLFFLQGKRSLFFLVFLLFFFVNLILVTNYSLWTKQFLDSFFSNWDYHDLNSIYEQVYNKSISLPNTHSSSSLSKTEFHWVRLSFNGTFTQWNFHSMILSLSDTFTQWYKDWVPFRLSNFSRSMLNYCFIF